MNERSSTRRELEASIRSIVPERTDLSLGTSQTTNVAAAGLGGLFTGYVWGWIRGRRSAKRRAR